LHVNLKLMKKFIVLLFVLAACGEKKAEVATETVLDPIEFQAKFQSTEDAILLDVRTEEEVSGGALAGQQNIVYDDAFANKLSDLEHKPIFVYCGSGIRSAKAAAILKEKGYGPIYEMKGGIKAWKGAGLPLQ
jgi:rhodanese-related sulfurtransferase